MGVSLNVYFGPSIDVAVNIDHKIVDHCKNHKKKESDDFCPRCGRNSKQRFQTVQTLDLNSDTIYLNSQGKETELLATFHDVSRWDSNNLHNKETIVNLIPSEPNYGLIKSEITELDFFQIEIKAEDIEKSLIKFEYDFATEREFLRKNYKIEVKNKFISWIC